MDFPSTANNVEPRAFFVSRQPRPDTEPPPVNGSLLALPPAASAVLGADASERLQRLESRLAVAEKSTKALLVEVVRLQAELGTSARATEQERTARREAEMRLMNTADTVQQLAARLDRTEAARRADSDAVVTLTSHVRNAEAAVLAARQDVTRRQDEQAVRLADVQDVVSGLRTQLTSEEQQRHQLEQSILQKLSASKTSAERQSLDRLQALETRINGRLQSLEVGRLAAVRDAVDEAETGLGRKISAVEAAQNKLRDETQQTVQSQFATLDKRLEQLESQQTKKDVDMQSLREQVEGRLETLYKLNQQELVAAQDTCQMSKKKTNKNLHRLNDAVSLLEQHLDEHKKHMDKLLTAEVQCRKNLEERWDGRFSDLKHESVDATQLEELQKEMDRIKTEMEKIDKDLTTACQDGQKYKAEFLTQISDMQSAQQQTVLDLHSALESLKFKEEFEQRINNLESARDQALQDIRSCQDALKFKEQFTKQLSELQSGHEQTKQDLQTCQDALKSVEKLKHLEADLKSHKAVHQKDIDELRKSLQSLPAPAAPQSTHTDPELEEKVRKLTLRHDRISETINQLREELSQIQTETLPQMEAKCNLNKSQVEGHLAAETKNRVKDIEAIKKRTVPTAADGQPVAPPNLHDLEEKIQKAAETIQIARTVLGMKIMSENKLRTAAVDQLNDEIHELRLEIFALKNPDAAEDNGNGGR